jgi:hypothetical protein
VPGRSQDQPHQDATAFTVTYRSRAISAP